MTLACGVDLIEIDRVARTLPGFDPGGKDRHDYQTLAGYLVKALDWAPFFFVTFLIALPGLALLVAMRALEAVIVTQKPDGDRRRIAIGEFYRLPGSTPEIENVLEPGELITHVELPPAPEGRQTYRKARMDHRDQVELRCERLLARLVAEPPPRPERARRSAEQRQGEQGRFAYPPAARCGARLVMGEGEHRHQVDRRQRQCGGDEECGWSRHRLRCVSTS